MLGLLAGVLLVVYASVPTRNYYWDGIKFALRIEDCGGTFCGSLVDPNHPLYCTVGNYARWVIERVQPIRALPLLQGMNAIAGAIAVLILGDALLVQGAGLRITLTAMALFGSGATWWRYASDANAYILSVLFLVIAFRIGSAPGPATPRRLALMSVAHVGAMLFHQMAVLFTPVAISYVIVKSRRRASAAVRCVLYGSVTGTTTVAIYAAFFVGITGETGLGSFVPWVLTRSSEAAVASSLFGVVRDTALSYARLLFGGRWRLFLTYAWDPPILAAAVVLAAVAVWLILDKRNERQTFRPVALDPAVRLMCWVWLVSFGIFLLFWEPRNAFYKLFVWAPIVFLLAGWMHRRCAGDVHRRAGKAVVALALVNWIFVVYPYSRAESSPLLQFSRQLGDQWSEATVLYREFATDNWYIRYFNPTTVWVHLDSLETLERAVSDCSAVWLDTTAVRYLTDEAQPEFEEYAERVRSGTLSEVVEGELALRFVQLSKAKSIGGCRDADVDLAYAL